MILTVIMLPFTQMDLGESIISSLAYHDIFDYPLTKKEIADYLIGKKTSQDSLEKNLAELVKYKKIGEREDFFFLGKRSNIVKIRKTRRKFSKSKFKKAIFFASLLKIVPTVKMVAVSGALAMGNSSKTDDIDFVIITSQGYLWTTRFFSNLLLWPFKRHPSSKKTSNRFCLNMFLDRSDLKISPQNLYIAHEICQMKPIFDRDQTYSRLISSNSWVKKFLPNWQLQIVNSKSKIVNRKKIQSPFTINYSLVENFLRHFQLWYMRSKITTEKIGEKQLFFHPQDMQNQVLRDYQKRKKHLKITSA